MIKINKNNALFHLIRFPNLIMIIIAQYLSSIFIVFKNEQFIDIVLRRDIFLLVLSTTLIAAGGYIINDYFDVKIDSVNKPQKLIIDHYIKRRIALMLHAFFTLAGLIISSFLSLQITLICLSTAFFLWIYSFQLKRRPLVGNILISLLTSISIYFPALLSNKTNHLLIIYALFAFFVSLIREIIKDIEDMKGDGLFGCQTLPLIYGMRFTKKIIVVVVVCFILCQLMIMLFSISVKLFILNSLTIVIMSIFLKKLSIADTRNNFSTLSKFCKWLMLAGIMSMIFIN